MLSGQAKGKLNIFLYIIGNELHFHNLQSLFAKTSLSDEIYVEKANSLSCNVKYNIEGCINDNIALKAANRLLDYAKELNILKPHNTYGAKINIIKNIPIASGLAGGSSDAATTLMLLNNLWQLGISYVDLLKIGLGLGSDIPFALQENVCCLVEGRGQILSTVELGISLPILMLTPPIHLETALVYKKFAKNTWEFRSKQRFTREAIMHHIFYGGNDLYSAALEIAPPLADVIEVLMSRPGCKAARMSGSGSTCFGIFENIHLARQAAHSIRSLDKEWWVHYEELCL